MPDCCSSSAMCSSSTPKALKCPICGKNGLSVQTRTILHHISSAWLWNSEIDTHFFCKTPDCNVAYFSSDGPPILQSDIRTAIGAKTRHGNATICYCFGITDSDYRSNPSIKKFVIDQTRHKHCSCETANPSGRCCLGDFPTLD